MQIKKTQLTWILVLGLLSSLQAQTPRREWTHKKPINHAHFSYDGRWVLVTGADSLLRVYHTRTGLLIRSLKTTKGISENVLSIPKSDKVVVIGSKNEVNFWDVETSKLLKKTTSDHANAPASLSVNNKGDLLAILGDKGGVHIWNTAYGIPTMSVATDTKATVASFHPTENKLLIGTTNDGVKMWDLTDYRQKLVLGCKGKLVMAKFINTTQIMVASDNGLIQFWDMNTGAEAAPFNCQTSIAVADVSADGTMLAVGTTDGKTMVWNLKSTEKLFEFMGSGKMTDLYFHPKEAILLTAFTNGIVRTWVVKK
jgi:WD40 repeat protein